jgi:uncharacterized membrane protein
VSVIDLAFVAVNSLASATLLTAAAAKFAVPQPLRRALHELVPDRGSIPVGVVKILAAAETLISLALLIPATRAVAGVGLGALGLLFAAAGLAGYIRRSAVPCGCLGTGSRALGLRNALVGLVLLGVAGLNVVGAPSSDPGLWRAAPLISAAATLVFCLWTHRRLAWRLLRTRPVAATN